MGLHRVCIFSILCLWIKLVNQIHEHHKQHLISGLSKALHFSQLQVREKPLPVLYAVPLKHTLLPYKYYVIPALVILVLCEPTACSPGLPCVSAYDMSLQATHAYQLAQSARTG